MMAALQLLAALQPRATLQSLATSQSLTACTLQPEGVAGGCLRLCGVCGWACGWACGLVCPVLASGHVLLSGTCVHLCPLCV